MCSRPGSWPTRWINKPSRNHPSKALGPLDHEVHQLPEEGNPRRIMRRVLQYRNEEEMSIGTIRAFDLLKAAASVCALIAIVVGLFSSCTGR